MLVTNSTKPSKIRVPDQSLRSFAIWILKHHQNPASADEIAGGFEIPVTASPGGRSAPGLRVVCISDTHNHQPEIPAGDILIHAGDLTEEGSAAEVEAQIKWLSSQPHRHKVVVAGNHDILLDPDFFSRYPEQRARHEKYPSSDALQAHQDWAQIMETHNIIYLQHASKTLIFPEVDEGEATNG